MAINNESEWFNCNHDPAELANHCRGLVDVQRFRWLAVQWGKNLLQFFSLAERQRFEAYMAWVNGDTNDPISMEPVPYVTNLMDFNTACANWYVNNVRTDPMMASGAAATRSHGSPDPYIVDIFNPLDSVGHEIEMNRAIPIRREFCDQFRDVAGNPFRPMTLDRRWLTDNVEQLAKTIDATGRYELMPILADALQEADCESEELLAHCREGKVHVRGCWAIDLLLDNPTHTTP